MLWKGKFIIYLGIKHYNRILYLYLRIVFNLENIANTPCVISSESTLFANVSTYDKV